MAVYRGAALQLHRRPECCSLDPQMGVAWSDESTTWSYQVSGSGLTYLYVAYFVEPPGHYSGEAFGHMLYHDNSSPDAGRNSRQYVAQCVGPARRCSNCDQFA